MSSADFFRISRQIDTFGNFWGYFSNFENLANSHFFLYFLTNWHIIGDVWGHVANFRNLQQFPSFFSEKFFYFDFDEICAKITLQISFIRFCSFGHSKLLQTWIFWYFSWNFFFLMWKKIPISKYFSMNWHIWEILRPILSILKFFQVFVLKIFGF